MSVFAVGGGIPHRNELFSDSFNEFTVHMEFVAMKVGQLVAELDRRMLRYTIYHAMRSLLAEMVWPQNPIVMLEAFLAASMQSLDPRAAACGGCTSGRA